MRHFCRIAWVAAVVSAVLVSAGSALGQEEGAQVDFGAPFVLAKGETMRVGSEGLSITLRSITEDSGCMEANDCSVMLFEGTIYLREGEQKLLMELDASFRPEKPADFKFQQHKVLLTAVQRVRGKLQASFRVEPGAEAE